MISVVLSPMLVVLVAILEAKEALAKVNEPLISLAIWAEPLNSPLVSLSNIWIIPPILAWAVHW